MFRKTNRKTVEYFQIDCESFERVRNRVAVSGLRRTKENSSLAEPTAEHGAVATTQEQQQQQSCKIRIPIIKTTTATSTTRK